MSQAKSISQNLGLSVKVSKIEGQKCHIFAKIWMPYSPEQVWQVITSYESFAEFIPNMSKSRRLAHPDGKIRLEQLRTKSLMGLKVSARSIVDIEEKYPFEVFYSLVEGDFNEFSGFWRLEEKESLDSESGVDLIYDFLVSPNSIIPTSIFSHFLKNDIPDILLAVRQRVEKLFG